MSSLNAAMKLAACSSIPQSVGPLFALEMRGRLGISPGPTHWVQNGFTVRLCMLLLQVGYSGGYRRVNKNRNKM